LDFFYRTDGDSEANHRFGLQWQGDNLKLFITDEKQSEARKEILETVAQQLVDELPPQILREASITTERLKAGRKGVFRSVKIARWPMWGDATNRAKQLVDLLNRMAKFIVNVEDLS
jgi:hypothetical protein